MQSIEAYVSSMFQEKHWIFYPKTGLPVKISERILSSLPTTDIVVGKIAVQIYVAVVLISTA